jgi:hypothetical protein
VHGSPTSRCLIALSLVLASGCASSDYVPYDVGSDSSSEDTGSPGSEDAATDALSDSYVPSDDASAPDATSTDATSATDAGADSSTDATVIADSAPADTGEAEGGEAAASVPPSLIGAWSFDEGTGTSSADLSGHGHPAVFAAGATWGPGKSGTGLLLNGTTSYADVGVTLIDTTKSFSVLAWAEFAVVNVGTWQVAASEDDVTGSLFGLKLRGDNNDFDFDVETSDVTNPGFVVAQSTSIGVASVWVQLAGVYDTSGQGSLTLYVDGVLQTTTAVNQMLLAASGHFVIGRGLYNSLTGSFVNGTLDDILVYDGALTDAQVATIYATGYPFDGGLGLEDAGADSAAPPDSGSSADASEAIDATGSDAAGTDAPSGG